MQKTGTVFMAITCAALGYGVGTYYGFKDGAQSYAAIENIAQGALARHHLASIEAGKINDVKHFMEINIDAAIHRYALYQDERSHFLSTHFMNKSTHELDQYFSELAEYRKTHPIVFDPNWAQPVADDDAKTKAWRAQGYTDSIEMLTIIKQALKEYDAKTSQE